MSWLDRPLICEGNLVRPGLDTDRLADADLREICFRMHVILQTIEMPRCEGRLIPANIFDEMDTLESMVLQGFGSPSGHRSPPILEEWLALIEEFGEYYQLTGSDPITVEASIYRDLATRYDTSIQCKPDRPSDD